MKNAAALLALLWPGLCAAAEFESRAPELTLPAASVSAAPETGAARAGGIGVDAAAAAPSVFVELGAAQAASAVAAPAADRGAASAPLIERAEAVARELSASPAEEEDGGDEGSYLVDVDGRSVGIERVETLYGRPVRVLDVSAYVQERRAKSQPDLKVFSLEQVFARPKAFLGFGLPNVYLSIPRADGGVEKIDAKSLKRADTKVVDTKGRVQSGLLVVLKDLDAAALQRMHDVALTHEGGREVTCVHANCLAMEDMGFTAGGKSLSEYYFPSPLLKAILERGLMLDGKPVAFDLVRTSPMDLETFRKTIDTAVKTTPWRHLQRAVPGLAGGQGAAREETGAPVESAVVRYPAGAPESADLVMSVSRPSGFGMIFRRAWGPHLLHRVEQSRVSADAFLPERLKPFPQANPSLATRLKKRVLFSRPVVSFLRRHLAGGFETFEGQTDGRLFDMIRTHSDAAPNKYNLVIEGSAISVMKIDGAGRVGRTMAKLADWVLSKHVLMSGYSEDVRFAGEVWKGEDGRIYVSNNSGTYQPTGAQLEKAVEYLRAIFPGAEFVAVDASAG